ncbi:MAG: GGDEF domain-containing protein [Candidatus Aenigmarchaeota archaeon]|nr:GGDEF domain-containing protein [Candidatus Aenigmarchaeota archaeon]
MDKKNNGPKRREPIDVYLAELEVHIGVRGLDEDPTFDSSWRRVKEEIESLKARALGDGLLGFGPRRVLDADLAREIPRAVRTGSPLALGFVDVDKFGDFNNRYGHEVGDQVLIAVGMAIRNSTRPEDYLFRPGGDELAYLLPRADLKGAEVVARRIKDHMEDYPVKVGDKRIPITLSQGVTYWDPKILRTSVYPGELTPEIVEGVSSRILTQADLAAYACKENGRDGIYAWIGGEPPRNKELFDALMRERPDLMQSFLRRVV